MDTAASVSRGRPPSSRLARQTQDRRTERLAVLRGERDEVVVAVEMVRPHALADGDAAPDERLMPLRHALVLGVSHRTGERDHVELGLVLRQLDSSFLGAVVPLAALAGQIEAPADREVEPDEPVERGDGSALVVADAQRAVADGTALQERVEAPRGRGFRTRRGASYSEPGKDRAESWPPQFAVLEKCAAPAAAVHAAQKAIFLRLTAFQMSLPDSDVTRLLVALSDGDGGAADRLYPVVYDELRRIAHARLRAERDGHTLATVDLVHEAYLRLAGGTDVGWQSRVHFFAVASSVMRRLLVDWARARRAAKRGGSARLLSLDDAPGEGGVLLEAVAAPMPDETLVALDDALTRLAARSSRQARVVECRYFGGLTLEETAEALGVSPSTVKDDWRLARAWLAREMEPD